MSLIEIIEPKENWQCDFQEIRNNLCCVLEAKALRIDHIGSTSIAGLVAKDVIDIQISVADLKDLEVVNALIRDGYSYLSDVRCDNLVGYDKDSRDLKKYFFREKQGDRRAHIHIRKSGRVNQKYAILFRDFLRADKFTKQAYAKVKQELALRFQSDADAYYAIKDPYMDTIFRAATLWAMNVGWEMLD